MKKILTIVVGLLVGVSSVWAVESRLTLKVSTAVECAPEANGNSPTASVQPNSLVSDPVEKSPEKLELSIETILGGLMNILLGDNINFEFTVYLQTECPSGDYIFSHWTDGAGNKLNIGQNANHTIMYTMPSSEMFSVKHETKGPWYWPEYWSVYEALDPERETTFTAHWVQPRVTGVNPESVSLEKITDRTDTRTKDVIFTVENALDKFNFTCAPDGDGFSLNTTLWESAQANYYIASVLYTPTGVHGTHTGTVTLTSKYPNINATTATSTLTVEEDYTPDFTVPAEYYVSTQASPTYVGSFTQLVETDIVPTDMNYAARTILVNDEVKKDGSIWKVELEENTSGFFSLETIDGNQVVRFTPTGAIDDTNPYTAKLKITSTYYDATGFSISTSKYVQLYAYAKVDDTSRLEIGGSNEHTMSFDVIYGTAQNKSVSFVANNLKEELKENWTSSSGQITFVNNGSMITVSVSNTIALGEHTASLVYSCGEKTATLNITANVQLATPVLNAYGGLSQITLVWTPVYGADKYIIESGETEPVEVEASTNSYIHTGLANGTEVSYTVTAVYTADESYNTTSNEATATPNMPTTITADDVPYIGLYTGTEGNNNTYPYKKKWQVDLSSTFDANENALFDRLYIFGMTTGDGGDLYAETTEKTSNAITPCYIYNKINDKTYSRAIIIPNMNVANKNQDYFSISITGENTGMKLYLTGWCPYATTGYTKDEHGVLHVKGHQGHSVDVYMEECYLYSRVHLDAQSAEKPYGSPSVFNTFTYGISNNLGSVSAAGAASSFVFECSYGNGATNSFYPKVHIKGSNLVFGHRGASGEVLGKIMGQYSAPIFLRPADRNIYDVQTELTLDDIWPTDDAGNRVSTHTNGYLKFEKNWEAGPSIDIGNERGVVTFNGGRFELAASQPKQVDYTNNLAICYRNGIVKVSDKEAGATAGMAGDGTGGAININDGSVYVTPFKTNIYNNNSILIDNSKYFEDIVYIDEEPYSQTLRLPATANVRGGSHKGYIRACANIASSGTLPSDGFYTLEQRRYGVPEFMLDSPFVDGDFFLTADKLSGLYTTEKIISEKSPDLNGKTLKQYYEDNTDIYMLTGGSYGRASIAPEEEDGMYYVYLWVPGDAKKPVSYVQWQVFMPKVKATVSGITAQAGGDDDIAYEEYPLPNDAEEGTEPEPKTILQNLLYSHLDNNMLSKLRTPDLKVPIVPPGGGYLFTELSEVSEKQYANIEAENSYKINKSIYYAMIAVADEWITFCPPFDVSRIWVLETCSEDYLNTKTRAEALSIQAQCNVDCAVLFGTQLTPDSYNTLWDIYDKSYKSYVNYVKNTANKDDEPDRLTNYTSYSTSSPQMPRTELVHLYKTNAPEGQPQYNYADAHYYLYQIDNSKLTLDGISDTAIVDEYGDTVYSYLKFDWELAPATTIASDESSSCVMKKGQVYAMQFPYCPGCDKDEAGKPVERTYWDYWTGKFIVFEGVGPQTIAGTSAHAGIMANNVLGLYGNYTFSELKFADYSESQWENMYVNNGGQFLASLGDELLTTGQSFLYVPTPSSLPGRIKSINAETGAITWEEGDDDNQGTTTGTPTISGNRQMMVYTIEGGVGIIPVTAQQVSIYNAAGQLVTSQYLTAETTVSLPAGIYLISGEKEQAKAIVR